MQTHIETSGAYKLTGIWDWICLSPKKMKLPTKEVYKAANELKVIVFNKDDFRFAEEQAAKVNKDCILYLTARMEQTRKNESANCGLCNAKPKMESFVTNT